MNSDFLEEAVRYKHEMKEAIRFYVDRLRPTVDQETGTTEDEIDRLTLALELAVQDKQRFASNLHDLKHAIREAMVRIESEKLPLDKATSSHEILHTKCFQYALDILKECCGEFL